MKNNVLLSILLLSLYLSSTAQTELQAPCSTPPFTPSAIQNLLGIVNDNFARTNDTLYIPVTFNIVGTDIGSGYYPVESVLKAFCQLQTDFEPYYFHFYIEGDFNYINDDSLFNMLYDSCVIDSIFSQHNIDTTMNVYIVNARGGSVIGDDTLDFSVHPVFNNPQDHAIVINKFWLDQGGHIFTHEVGHYFALWHTFLGWEFVNNPDYGSPAPDTLFHDLIICEDTITLHFPVERVNGDSCGGAGDFLCDTPPDYLNVTWPCDSSQESSIVQLDPDNISFKSDGALYMSYSNGNCQDRFSPQQVEIMRWCAENPRDYLLYNQTSPELLSIDDLVLNSPPNEETVPVFDSFTLEWEMPGADFYLLEYGVNLNGFFNAINSNIFLKENYYEISVNEEGAFYWIVRGVSNYFPCEVWEDTSYFFAIIVDIDVADVADLNFMSLFPNPTNDKLYLHFPNPTVKNELLEVNLFDTQGRLMSTQFISDGQTIEMGDLPPGMYLLKAVDDKKIYSGKFVKQ